MRTLDEERQRIKPHIGPDAMPIGPENLKIMREVMAEQTPGPRRFSDAAVIAMLAFVFTCILVAAGLLLRGGLGL